MHLQALPCKIIPYLVSSQGFFYEQMRSIEVNSSLLLVEQFDGIGTYLKIKGESVKKSIYLPTPSSCPRGCVVGAACLPRVRVDHLSQLPFLFAFLAHHFSL